MRLCDEAWQVFLIPKINTIVNMKSISALYDLVCTRMDWFWDRLSHWQAINTDTKWIWMAGRHFEV